MSCAKSIKSVVNLGSFAPVSFKEKLMWFLVIIAFALLFLAIIVGIALFFAWIGALLIRLESYIIDRLLKRDDPELYSITTDWRNHDFA